MTQPAVIRSSSSPVAPFAHDVEKAVAYSFGVAAIILLRLDARPAEWVPVADLAQHLGCSLPSVRAHLETLAANGQVTVQRVNVPCAACQAGSAGCQQADCGEIYLVRA